MKNPLAPLKLCREKRTEHFMMFLFDYIFLLCLLFRIHVMLNSLKVRKHFFLLRASVYMNISIEICFIQSDSCSRWSCTTWMKNYVYITKPRANMLMQFWSINKTSEGKSEECCNGGCVHMATWSLIRGPGVYQEIQYGSLRERMKAMGQTESGSSPSLVSQLGQRMIYGLLEQVVSFRNTLLIKHSHIYP